MKAPGFQFQLFQRSTSFIPDMVLDLLTWSLDFLSFSASWNQIPDEVAIKATKAPD